MGNHKNHDQDSRPWKLNPGLPNCEAGVLPLHHTGLVSSVISLMPKSWSKVKICNELNVSEHLLQVKRELVKNKEFSKT